MCWLMLLIVGAGTAASCTDGPADTDGGDGTGTITVAAASSLTDAFTELGGEFEQANPGTTIRFNFGSSSVLARQIIEGAPATVFASADQLTMNRVANAGLVAGSPATFARNELIVISRPDTDPPVGGVEDLPSVGVVALCAPTAPCGLLSEDVLDRAGVELPEGQVSRAPNARATLRAVSDGDAEAALVYATDAKIAGESVLAMPLPPTLRLTTPYLASVLTEQPANEVAAAFVEFLQTPAAEAVLARHGFGTK